MTPPNSFVRCITTSGASKLGPIAATYRAGNTAPYATCPTSCPLLPKGQQGTTELDTAYLETVIRSRPRAGHSWTYTHFPATRIPAYDGGTVINISTDSVVQALKTAEAGYPTTYTAPVSERWPRRIEGRQFALCPATRSKHVTCANCGGGKPLCARADRDYVIVFPAHGSQKKLVGPQAKGGCYGAQGNVWIHWADTASKIGSKIIDNVDIIRELPRWTRQLTGRLLRHHIVGDLGLARIHHQSGSQPQDRQAAA